MIVRLRIINNRKTAFPFLSINFLSASSLFLFNHFSFPLPLLSLSPSFRYCFFTWLYLCLSFFSLSLSRPFYSSSLVLLLLPTISLYPPPLFISQFVFFSCSHFTVTVCTLLSEKKTSLEQFARTHLRNCDNMRKRKIDLETHAESFGAILKLIFHQCI